MVGGGTPLETQPKEKNIHSWVGVVEGKVEGRVD